jgi:hypothetical protein
MPSIPETRLQPPSISSAHRWMTSRVWTLRRHLTAPEDQHGVNSMIDEHRSLSTAIQFVDGALARSVNIATAVDQRGRALHDHLDHEERSALPLLEQHLSRAEWRAFLLTECRPIPAGPARFLGWVLDGANEPDTNALLAELPPPGRLVSRYPTRPRLHGQASYGHGLVTPTRPLVQRSAPCAVRPPRRSACRQR